MAAELERRLIPGWDGYAVDADGNVWTRYVQKSRGLGGGTVTTIGETWRPRVLNTSRRTGYLMVWLRGVGSQAVHTLVLAAFVGPRPAGMVARHLDGDRRNNRPTNLVWGTPQQNADDRIAHGRSLRGEESPVAKLSWEQVRAIRSRWEGGERNVSALSREYRVGRAAIRNVVNGKTWLAAHPARTGDEVMVAAKVA